MSAIYYSVNVTQFNVCTTYIKGGQALARKAMSYMMMVMMMIIILFHSHWKALHYIGPSVGGRGVSMAKLHWNGAGCI